MELSIYALQELLRSEIPHTHVWIVVIRVSKASASHRLRWHLELKTGSEGKLNEISLFTTIATDISD